MTDVAFKGALGRVAREAFVSEDEVTDVLECPHCGRRRVQAVACPVMPGLIDVRVDCFGCEVSWRMSVTGGDLGWRCKLARMVRRLGFGRK